jgi:hypothetical protein
MPIEDTSGQFIEFYKKKATNLVEIAENHYKNKELRKAVELLSQAYSFYKKAGEFDKAEQVKQQFEQIKAELKSGT